MTRAEGRVSTQNWLSSVPSREHLARISNRASRFSLSPIKEIELKASKIPGAISLAQGIPYLNTPQEIVEYVEEKIRAGLCDRYSLSPGLEELREELALSLGTDGAEYDPEKEMIVTAGSIQGMTATLLALVQRGDEVLVPSPTYASYIGSIHLSEATPVYVPLDEDTGFDLSLEAFEQAITPRTRAIILCTPNNPTGTVFSSTLLEGLLRLAVKNGIYVIVDEVYKDFYFSPAGHISPAAFPWAREYLIRVCSFSKAYAMTGWRVGFLAAPSHVTESILKIHDVMVSCAPVASQYAAIAALRYGESARLAAIEEFRQRRDLTVAFLDQMSEWLDYQVPQATYFAFPRIKDTVPLARQSRRLVYDILKKANVAFVEGAAFGPSGESHLRINFGRSEEDIREGMTRFGDYLQRTTAGRRLQRKIKNVPLESMNKSLLSGKQKKQRLLVTLTRLARRNVSGPVVAIIGMRGKTIVRRIISESLSKQHSVISSHLSHNTLTGLSFSILELSLPKNTREKLRVVFQILKKALIAKRRHAVSILECGITKTPEVQQYVSLVRPDYIIVTSGLGFDPNLKKVEHLHACREFIKHSSPRCILIPEDEKWLIEELDPNNELSIIPVLPTEGTSCGRSESYGKGFAHHLLKIISTR
ncbi:aminotransferase class I/II-fold pyridoxal phosphate-dependent enzyme [bacterium]|nr:aminotransferase class I/II-fold pyridoxal phosphate-dependent enzyme [bacterium]